MPSLPQHTLRNRRSFVSGASLPAVLGGVPAAFHWDMGNASLSGSDILTVPDSSGHGIILTGPVSNRPTFVAASTHFNNKPAADFASGTAQRLEFGDPVLTTNGPTTIAMVCKGLTDSATNAYVLSLLNDHAGVFSSPVDDFWHTWHSSNLTAVDSDNSKLSATIIFLTLSGGTQRAFFNSITEEGSGAMSSGVTYVGGAIGNYAMSPSSIFGLAGQVAEVIGWNKELSVTERTASANALASKYNITLS